MISYNYTQAELKKCGIYALVCIPTGKMYIGQTRRGFLVRWLEHYGELIKGKHNSYLQHAFNKYGETQFKFIILEFLPDELQIWCDNRKYEIDEHISKFSEWLNEKESEIIKNLRHKHGNHILFNLNDGGDGNTNPTLELRHRISEERKERWKNPEYKKKVSQSLKGKRIMSDDERKEISIRSKELWASGEYRSKHKSRKGYKSPDITRKRCSDAQKKYFESEIARRKVSVGVKKYFESKEARKLRAEQARKVYEDKPELKDKLSSICKAKWQDVDYQIKMYKSHGYDTRKIFIDCILSDAYKYLPELKKLPSHKKVELILYIASQLSLHDKES